MSWQRTVVVAAVILGAAIVWHATWRVEPTAEGYSMVQSFGPMVRICSPESRPAPGFVCTPWSFGN